MTSNCPNEGICYSCGKIGHCARNCWNTELPPGEVRLCNNCFEPGHIAADRTNDKACKKCRETGHIARDCLNEPVCNLCNISGHVARQCLKPDFSGGRNGGRGHYGGFHDVVCQNCSQLGHMSRDCLGIMICHNCGGRGHAAFECPSGRFMDCGPPWRY
ncbi:Zinc finger protein [Actinidia chinensis var. chinensis]|uniref:Zinc finger protein n=1 Tax=Actinidia chinensis var. chinensis TaxID=1590841 RepID=A0A2R6RMN7_ACTCC|nr:Zinc finger protein [Actinidia chinensis var. chinensis]